MFQRICPKIHLGEPKPRSPVVGEGTRLNILGVLMDGFWTSNNQWMTSCPPPQSKGRNLVRMGACWQQNNQHAWIPDIANFPSYKVMHQQTKQKKMTGRRNYKEPSPSSLLVLCCWSGATWMQRVTVTEPQGVRAGVWWTPTRGLYKTEKLFHCFWASGWSSWWVPWYQHHMGNKEGPVVLKSSMQHKDNKERLACGHKNNKTSSCWTINHWDVRSRHIRTRTRRSKWAQDMTSTL